MAVSKNSDCCQLVALDDGDTARQTSAEVQWLVQLGKMGKLEDTRGLVADVWQAEKALGVSHIKVGGRMHPAGVLVGDGLSALCGKPIYSAHHLNLPLVEAAFDGSDRSRPSRGGMGSGDGKLGGLATFRRGDHVISTGTPAADEAARETVYGVMSFVFRQQQHRYLITYDEQLGEFSAGSWTAWRRLGPADDDEVEGEGVVVEVSSLELQSAMCAKWVDSPFACKSFDALHKLSQLGPVRDREARSNEKKATQRQRKAAKRERDRVASAQRELAERVAAAECASAEREDREGRDRGGGDSSGKGGRGGGGGGGSGGSDGFDAAVASAVAAALATAGVQGPSHAAAVHGSSTPQARQRAPDTPPSVVLLKRQVRGLKRAAMVEGVDALQRRADAILLGELEDELERKEAKRQRYG